MINYTENLKITLDETINQLELISIVASGKVDTGIIAWFNNNEGFVAFLGVIASFVVSVTAIVISVLTYLSQKKEQTKNAQENAKLQRELTEQNNKFQADLQIRQIKLDKFNIITSQLYYLFIAISLIIKMRFVFANNKFLLMSYKKISEVYKDSHEFNISFQNLSLELYKIKYLLPIENIQDYNEKVAIFSSICNSFSYITAIANSELQDKDEAFNKHFKITKEEFYENLMKELLKLEKEFSLIQKILEKDININDIQKI